MSGWMCVGSCGCEIRRALGPYDQEVVHIRAGMATDFHRQSAITHGYSERPCISDKDMLLLNC